MKLRFSSSPRGVEVSGARADFAAWAQELRQERGLLPMDTGKGAIRCETLPGAKVAISWDPSARELQMRGDAEWMDILSENVEGFSQDGEVGTPWHIEYFKGHAYLAPSCVPVACVLAD